MRNTAVAAVLLASIATSNAQAQVRGTNDTYSYVKTYSRAAAYAFEGTETVTLRRRPTRSGLWDVRFTRAFNPPNTYSPNIDVKFAGAMKCRMSGGVWDCLCLEPGTRVQRGVAIRLDDSSVPRTFTFWAGVGKMPSGDPFNLFLYQSGMQPRQTSYEIAFENVDLTKDVPTCEGMWKGPRERFPDRY